jgi:hypothetical protein
MTEADDRFLESLAPELAPLLGPRLTIREMTLDRSDAERVAITVWLDTAAGPRAYVEEGDSLTGVAAAILHRATEIRLAEGFREILEPARS